MTAQTENNSFVTDLEKFWKELVNDDILPDRNVTSEYAYIFQILSRPIICNHQMQRHLTRT